MKSIATILKSVVLGLLLATSAFASEKVNINTADARQLQAVLINVGPAKAEAIVEYRKENGPFKSIEELAMVNGIGLRTVELNRDRIELRGASESSPAAAATQGKPAAVTRR